MQIKFKITAESSHFRGKISRLFQPRNSCRQSINNKTLAHPDILMSISWVLKENGEKERFEKAKVKKAIRRSGLSPKECDEILQQLSPHIYNGISTKAIYHMVYDLIDQMRPEVSHRYNLKRALQRIGPAGYEFEDFIGRLLSLEGYDTKLRQTIQGRCLSHEIDVVAEKDSMRYMIECKFRNQPGYKCRIQTALYVYARFLDLKEGSKIGTCEKYYRPWLVTNTKFSQDVITYADYKEIDLLGWRYPFKNSLEFRIDKSKCYPVSVIKMGDRTLRQLLKKKIVTVFDFPETPEKLAHKTGISDHKSREILEKAQYVQR